MIWIVASLILLFAVVVLVWPFLRPAEETRDHADQGLAVYRRQLEELALDVDRGAINRADAESMETEIKRRMLRLHRTADTTGTGAGGIKYWPVALILAIGLPAISFALYADLGSPEKPSRPLAVRDLAAEQAARQAQDVSSLIQRLVNALKEQPDNLDGWVLLARTLSRMERYEEAAETYMKATVLAPTAVELYVGAGENYYFAAEGNISADAARAFETAAELDPQNPGVRYYLALRDAQEGDVQGALRKWISLYNESPADAPFMPVLASRIERTAEETGTDLAGLWARKDVPPAPAGPSSDDVAAAADMSAEERQAMISSMVERLAARMEETPEYDGLMRLGQVYGTIGNYEKSADAYGRARMLKPGDLAAVEAEAFARIQAAGSDGVPPESAVELYRDVIAENPDNPRALWYLGVAAAARGDNDAAIDYWTRLQEVTQAGSPVHLAAKEAIKSLSATDKN